MQALPQDCSGDFGPRGLSLQYTQDVCVCSSAHMGRLCVSLSTHRTSVAVHQHTQNVRGCPSVHISARWSLDSARWPFPWTVRVILAHVGCLFSTHRTSVDVRQQTQDVRGCPSAHTGHPWLSVCVRVYPSAHTGRPWLSISTHISMLVLGLSMLTLPVDCSGDFGPRGLSVQYTQDVRGCPPAHRTTHISTLVLGLRTLALPMDCSGDFVPRGLSVQYTQDVRQHTQDVRGCPSAHTGRPWLSVCVCVCPSAHTGRPWLSISTHISTLTLPMDCSGDFGPRGLSVQYTKDVCGCPSAHTGRLCVSVSTHRTSVAVRQNTQNVRGCPSVHISARCTHRTSVAVHQYTYQHAGPWTQHAGPSPGLFGTHRTSVAVRQHTQNVRGCPSVHISARWSLDSAHWPFPWTVRDVRGCPWVSVSTHRTSVAVRVCPCVSVSTHRTSVAVHQYTYQHVGPWTQHADPSRGLFGSFWSTWSVCSVHTGRPWVSTSTHRTSVAVRVCPSAHIGCLWLSISTHISTLVLGHSTLALPVDCLGDFGPRGQSVKYTQEVRGCPPVHTGRPWLSVAVRVCPSAHTGRPWLSISTHISKLVLGLSMQALPLDCSGDFGPRGLSVQYTQDVRVCPSAHTGRLRVSVSTHRMSVTHRTSVDVRQHTQDVCGCPSAYTGRPWLSVCVRVYPSAHTGRPWLSISTHISMLVLGLSMLTLPVDCSGDFGPRGLFVQYTQDVRGCPPAHTGRPWLSVCVRVCPSAHIGRLWLSISTHISMLVLGLSTLALPVDCSDYFGPCGLSVKYTQDVRGCPPAHTGRPWLSVPVRVCPSAHTGRPWLSISTHISKLVLGLSMQALPLDCSAHTGHPWLFVSSHRTSVAVHQYICQHAGPWTQHAGPSLG
ncbi:hypothetical protein YC2023_066032 [Brassica napus]